jgi:hypothetical protein
MHELSLGVPFASGEFMQGHSRSDVWNHSNSYGGTGVGMQTYAVYPYCGHGRLFPPKRELVMLPNIGLSNCPEVEEGFSSVAEGHMMQNQVGI